MVALTTIDRVRDFRSQRKCCFSSVTTLFRTLSLLPVIPHSGVVGRKQGELYLCSSVWLDEDRTCAYVRVCVRVECHILVVGQVVLVFRDVMRSLFFRGRYSCQSVAVGIYVDIHYDQCESRGFRY